MMLATGRGKVRGRCPECRAEVWLTEEELGQALGCNVCGTTFHVARKRRRRYTPGYWKIAALPLLPPPDAPVPRKKPRRSLPSWLLTLIVLLLLALLFLLFGGDPASEDWFPARISRAISRLF